MTVEIIDIANSAAMNQTNSDRQVVGSNSIILLAISPNRKKTISTADRDHHEGLDFLINHRPMRLSQIMLARVRFRVSSKLAMLGQWLLDGSREPH